MDRINCLLLVDDDKITNFLNERIIKTLNLATTIKVVNNGMEALGYIGEFCSLDNNKCCPDLVFLDINMPIMNGIEFLEQYKNLQIEKTTRIVILTTSSDQRDIGRIKELGNFEYLIKPLTKEKIINLLQLEK